jgi:hypothetical protein
MSSRRATEGERIFSRRCSQSCRSLNRDVARKLLLARGANDYLFPPFAFCSGSRFDKDPSTSHSTFDVFFGSKPSSYTEVRCVEVSDPSPPLPIFFLTRTSSHDRGRRFAESILALFALSLPLAIVSSPQLLSRSKTSGTKTEERKVGC